MDFDYSKLKGRIIEVYGKQAAFAAAMEQNRSKYREISPNQWGECASRQRDTCFFAFRR